MYRGTPSPIFDAPEFPTLRRVKPLPKRRRMTMAHTGNGNENMLSFQPTSASALAAHGAAAAIFHHQQQGSPLEGLGPNPTSEELLAHADTLSARMALQNYYIPILGGVQSFLAGAAGGQVGGDGGNSTGNGDNNNSAAAAVAALAAVTGIGRNGQQPIPNLSELDSLEFGMHFAAAAAAAAGVAMGGLGGFGLGGMNMGMGAVNITMGGGNGNGNGNGYMSERGGHERDDDDGRGDGDDFDHLRQQGNTKKRKVPANSSPRTGSGGDSGQPGSPSSAYLDDEGADGDMGGEGEDLQLHIHRERDRDRDREQGIHRSRSRDSHYSHSNSNSNSNSYTHSQTHPSQQRTYPLPSFPGQLSMLERRRGKLTAVTLAGLQHKELLKTRKRQLAAVMGALSHGDTFALDQALTSASYGYGFAGNSGLGTLGLGDAQGRGQDQGQQQGQSIRKSKRQTVRLARVMKRLLEMPERRVPHPDAVPFPVSDFGFVCSSRTADRLIATKEEVAGLRKRFEVELEKQAAKAAKLAVATGAGGPGSGKVVKATGGKGKRERQERDRERAEKAQAQMQKMQKVEKTSSSSLEDGTGVLKASGAGNGNGNIQTPPPALLPSGGKSKNGKKKKRSALANASNPHHLKNYVPSRLPHSDGWHGGGAGGGGVGGVGTGGGGANSWPLPIRFLSSEIPPRNGTLKKGSQIPNGPTAPGNAYHPPLQGQTGHVPLTYPAEEWICAFCEYDLFYGGDAEYRRAVRNRKKILKRRRRARERAARAASGAGVSAVAGKAAPPAPPPSEEEDEVYGDEEGHENSRNNVGHGTGQKAGKWKGDG